MRGGILFLLVLKLSSGQEPLVGSSQEHQIKQLRKYECCGILALDFSISLIVEIWASTTQYLRIPDKYARHFGGNRPSIPAQIDQAFGPNSAIPRRGINAGDSLVV